MKNFKKLKGMLWLVLAMGVITVFTATNVFAVTFELDGNAMQGADEDWQTLYNGGGSATTFTGIVPDKNGTDNIFTGGGSKTPNLIEDWMWKSSPPPPDKDNITHAYAANYNVAGEQVIYFGADLYADNGDAELAFWFFQDNVNPTASGFDGEHVDEDAYVAVKFSNGGTQANITVYEWWSACDKQDIPSGNSPLVAGDCAADNIRVLVPETTAVCVPGSEVSIACAITNTGTETSPWTYTPKSGSANTFPPTTFFEGGINIYEVFGANKCFSSFMATTGASTSFTATAKDFALGDFNVCSVDVTKICENDSEDDDSPGSYKFNVRGCGINDGGAAIEITTFENAIGGDASYDPTPVWYVPGQVGDPLRDFDPSTDCENDNLLKEAIANGASTTSLIVEAGDALIYEFVENTDMNGATDTVTIDADAVDIVDADIDADTATATCSIVEFPASLIVNKQCTVKVVELGANLVVKIEVAGSVCNTGKVELTSLTLLDNTDPPISGINSTLIPLSTTLAPMGDEGDCTTYTGFYYPDSLPNGDLCPFADQVKAVAIAGSFTRQQDGCTYDPEDTSDNPTSICTAFSNTATCELRVGNDDGLCSTGLPSNFTGMPPVLP